MKLNFVSAAFIILSVITSASLAYSQEAPDEPKASMTPVTSNTNSFDDRVPPQPVIGINNNLGDRVPPPPPVLSTPTPEALPQVKNNSVPLPPAVTITSGIQETPTEENAVKPPFTIDPKNYYIKQNGSENWTKGFEDFVEGFYGLHASKQSIVNNEKPVWLDDAFNYLNTELQGEINKTFNTDLEQKESHKNIIRKTFTNLVPIESIAINNGKYYVLISNYTTSKNQTIANEWFFVPTTFLGSDHVSNSQNADNNLENTTKPKASKKYEKNPVDKNAEFLRHNESSKVWDKKTSKK